MKYIILSIIFTSQFFAIQKVGFIASEVIREKFPEAERAEQRIQSNVEQWKRELENFDIKIQNVELDLKKNRLLWTESEIVNKETQIQQLQIEKQKFASTTFDTGGKYDQLVKTIWKPIEDKIFAAVAAISAEQNYDFIFDKSLQPVPYTNYRYDITVDVLERLGVDVEKMKEELKKKINEDPRNQKPEPKTVKKRAKRRSRGRKSRGRTQEEESQEEQSETEFEQRNEEEEEKREEEQEPEVLEQENPNNKDPRKK